MVSASHADHSSCWGQSAADNINISPSQTLLQTSISTSIYIPPLTQRRARSVGGWVSSLSDTKCLTSFQWLVMLPVGYFKDN